MRKWRAFGQEVSRELAPGIHLFQNTAIGKADINDDINDNRHEDLTREDKKQPFVKMPTHALMQSFQGWQDEWYDYPRQSARNMMMINSFFFFGGGGGPPVFHFQNVVLLSRQQ